MKHGGKANALEMVPPLFMCVYGTKCVGVGFKRKRPEMRNEYSYEFFEGVSALGNALDALAGRQGQSPESQL